MKISRRKLLCAGLFGVPLGGLGAYWYARGPGRTGIVTQEVEVPVAGLAQELDGLRIVHLSDFHIDPLMEREHHAKAVAIANALRPDVVMMTGDFVSENAEAVDELAPELEKLEARLGVFACLGNHDWWHGRFRVAKALDRVGIRVLENGGVSLRNEGTPLFVAGVESAWAGRVDPTRAIVGHEGDEATVMLCHEPDFFHSIAGKVPFSLMLAGHTHGGQVRCPGLGAIVLPHLGKRYVRGIYQMGGALLHVNPGIGTIDHHVRLFCRPEVTVLTLRVVV